MGSASVKMKTKKTQHGGFGALAKNLDASMDMVVYRFAIGVQKNARLNAPVDTGLLKSRIKAKKIRKGMWVIDVDVHYGVYVEYGTRYMAAQPYFRPAIETMRKKMHVDFKAVFKNGNQARLT